MSVFYMESIDMSLINKIASIKIVSGNYYFQ